MKPEYLPAVSNHVLVAGLGTGLVTLILALLIRSRPAQIVGLAVVLLSAGAAYPVLLLGQEGYRSAREVSDDSGKERLDTQMEQAEKLAVLYCCLSIVALAALILPKYKPGAALPLAIATVVMGSASTGAGVWIAMTGGQFGHPEFRGSPELEDEVPDLTDDPPHHEH